MSGIGIDEFTGKPDGTFTASERMRFIGVDITFPDSPSGGSVIIAPHTPGHHTGATGGGHTSAVTVHLGHTSATSTNKSTGVQ